MVNTDLALQLFAEAGGDRPGQPVLPPLGLYKSKGQAYNYQER